VKGRAHGVLHEVRKAAQLVEPVEAELQRGLAVEI